MNVLAFLPGLIPSTIIGILRPLTDLERRGEIRLRIRLTYIPILASNDIEWCDVAVFCRNCEGADLSALYELKRRGKKIVYELDDNFEEIPFTTDVGVYHRHFSRLHVVKRFFLLSDITRVYSDRMYQRASKYGARVQTIRSYFDKSIIEGLCKDSSADVIKIAYPTGRIDDNELEERIFSAVKTVLHKYETKVEFHLWRKSLPQQLIGIKGVVLNKNVRGYDKFIRTFFRAGFDIGLAPGNDIPFFHSKTNNKYREFGGCGVSGIYSNFPPYSSSIDHEHSGLLAGSSTEEWVTAIERLVLDKKLRTNIADNAAKDIFSNYSFETAVESWRECFGLMRDHKPDLPEWIPVAKQFNFFSYIHLEKPKESDDRYKYLQLALSSLQRNTFIEFNSISEYLASPIKNFFSACIIFLSNKEQLQILSELMPLLNSAIVDITNFEDEAHSAINHLFGVAPSVPISFLVTREQERACNLTTAQQGCMISIESNPSPFVHNFSLSGYPAAYLDLVERHIHFSLKKIKTGRLARLSARICLLRDWFLQSRDRFKTVYKWMLYRLGFRQF
jgi:hypothetical protein